MENQWYRHTTRNDISRFIAAKKRWIENQDYFMRCIFLNYISHPECLPQNFRKNLMAAHCLNHISSCMVFPPPKPPPLYHSPHPFQFASSRRAMNSGMLSDRHKHRPIPTRYLRDEQPIRERDWRRTTNDERSQIYKKEFDINLPSSSSSSFQRFNKDVPRDKSAERTKGRKLRSTNWSPKESRTSDNSVKEQNHDKDQYNRFYRGSKCGKHCSHNCGIREHDVDIAGLQCGDPSIRSEEKDSHTQLSKNRCAPTSSENTILRKRKDRSSQSTNSSSPSAVGKEISKGGKRKIQGTSWAVQVEKENAFVESSVVNSIEQWNWFCKDEQQRIVDTLKEEDLNHQQQLMQNLPHLGSSNQGKGDSLNPSTICNVDFSEEDCPEALEKSFSSSSEDGITVIVPTDAFSKSLQVFTDKQPDIDAISAVSTDFSESSTIETQSLFHERELLIDTNPRETLDLMNHEDWGKYCVGWSADIKDQKDQLLETHDQTDSICNLLSCLGFSETVPTQLPDEMNTKAENEIRNFPFDQNGHNMLDSEVQVPEFHPCDYDIGVEQNPNAQMSQLPIIDAENSESLPFEFEDGDAFIRSFGLNSGSACCKSHHIHQILSPKGSNNIFVNNIEKDLIKDKYPKNTAVKINNYCCDSDRNHQSTKSKPCDSQAICNATVPACKKYRPCYPLTVNQHCPPRLIDTYIEKKEYPIYTDSYHNSYLLSATANKVVDDEGPSASSLIDNKHNVKASNYLKFILGIPTNMDGTEDGKGVGVNPVINDSTYYSEVSDAQSFAPIACSLSKQSELSTRSSCCATYVYFPTNSSSSSTNSKLVNKSFHLDCSSEWKSPNTALNSAKKSFKCRKNANNGGEYEPDNNSDNPSLKLGCNSGKKTGMQDMDCESENKIFTQASKSHSQLHKIPGSPSQQKTKIKKSKKEKKCEMEQSKEFRTHRYNVVTASAGMNSISKKISNSESITRNSKHSSDNQNIIKDNSELKTLKGSKVTPAKGMQNSLSPDNRLSKNIKNSKFKATKKSNSPDKKQHVNKCKVPEHLTSTKPIKTNAEIAAEYQSRRRAKLYHERNINAMEPESATQCLVTRSLPKLNNIKPSIEGKTNAPLNRNAGLNANDIENVCNKLDRIKHHERKLFDSKATGKTRVEENELKYVNIIYNESPNIANLHETMNACLPSNFKVSNEQEDDGEDLEEDLETCMAVSKQKDQRNTGQQKRNFNEQIIDGNLKNYEYESYDSFSETIVIKSAMLHCETQQSFVPSYTSSFHYSQNFILPWTVENCSNPLSHKLRSDLLRVSHFFCDSIPNYSKCLFPNASLQHPLDIPLSNQMNPLQNIDFKTVARRGGEGLDALFCDYSSDFPIKFYDFLYHSWRICHPLETGSICRRGFDKRVLFASWLRRGFVVADSELSER